MPSEPPYEVGIGTLGRGASIGRYVILGLVGRGGMGEVYAAYDPELDRKVALKLLRVSPGNGVSLVEGRQRTLREAQAIARLSHPNVVVVYDVGTFNDQVFIAMEFVEGNTLTHWLHAEARSWPEIRSVFLAAGRGLMAAHEKGLVHRDFKPDNVMVGRDGQVRVMDFGLARQVDEQGPPGEAGPSSEQGLARDVMSTLVIGPLSPATDSGAPVTSSSGAFEGHLTRTGAMMGTPAYMAPEQFLGTATDARTDQFSFCVALYEAVYECRPFAADSMYALTTNVVQGKVGDPPEGVKVPVWLRRVLLRGLRPSAADRYPSMRELLVALEKDPAAERRRWLVGAAAVLLPVAIAFGVRASMAGHAPVCGGATDRLAGVWELAGARAGGEPPRRAAIRRAFLATGKSYAAGAFATVSELLTRYAQSWAGMYREACEATQVRGEQSPEVLDLRMSCLSERLGGLRALVQVFSQANGDVVENAVSAANSLAPLDRCADVPLLRSVVRPPEDREIRARVEELRPLLAELKALLDAGRWREARDKAPALVARVSETGYRALLAETLSTVGRVHLELGETEQAEATLLQAYWAADASRDDEVRGGVADQLIWVTGMLGNRIEEAQHWAKAAAAVQERLGGGHDLMRAWVLNSIGSVYIHGGPKLLPEAPRALEEALALKVRVLGRDHPDVAIAEVNLAVALQELGRNQEALAHVERGMAIAEKTLGSEHPRVATYLSDRGEILNALGRPAEARRSFEGARIIWERELGLDHRNVAYALTGIGRSYLAEEQPASALTPLERALKIREQHESDPTLRAETSFALARALWDTNRNRRRAQALAAAARATYLEAGAHGKQGEVDEWLATHRGV
jgi:tetratricopeptide (TPR) repeat protein